MLSYQGGIRVPAYTASKSAILGLTRALANEWASKNINVNAIEDYREVSERYEFMRAQHEDLVNAQAELEKIIEELDIGMRRQFEEKFREIRAEFDKVFKELFGGGRGALELMEGEDLLEAGIQIIAQPPGKKLQNMMQLSGGEKGTDCYFPVVCHPEFETVPVLSFR